MKWNKKVFVPLGLAALVGTGSFLFPVGGSQKAYAATDISYKEGASKGYLAQYSSNPQLHFDYSVTAPAGQQIASVALLEDGLAVKQFSVADGQTSFSLTNYAATGDAIELISSNSAKSPNIAKGYFAWYRYGYAGGDYAWHADFDGGVTRTCSSGPADPDYPGMTLYPTCSSQSLNLPQPISLPGKRTAPYVFVSDNTKEWTDYSSIAKPHNFVPKENRNVTVDGPTGVPSGTSQVGDSNIIKVDGDINNFRVYYNQSFGSTLYYKDMDSPGAKMDVYYAAFDVDIYAYTYKYPDQIAVTFGPLPSSPTPTPTPAPGKPSGDFDITPSTINYRDSFSLVPKNLKLDPGCTYQGHVYQFSKDGINWTSSTQTSYTAKSYSYSNYPPPVSAGTVTISMQISSTCGTSDWVSHDLTVRSPPNDPPYFKLGWFNDGDGSSITPLTTVVQGTKLMVRAINDPHSNPPSPSDPNGDPISITNWDFDSGGAFVSSLPAKYGFTPRMTSLNGIVMDTVGYHNIGATLTDSLGASYTAYTSVQVIPPNPVPVCKLNPNTVKSGRPVADSTFDGSGSYSPVGNSIVTYTWGNKKTAYTNDTASPTQETVTLDVTDSAGLKSLQPAPCTLTVNPDLPPVAKLDVPPLSLRGQAVDLFNQSVSNDGDVITSVSYRYKYDAANNGFADDAWQALSGTMTKATFTPTKVGKYLFDITATEDYGKSDDLSDVPESARTLDIINLAPSVSFNVGGNNPQPDFNPSVQYSADTILSSWSLYKTNTTSAPMYVSWYTKNNALSAGLGRAYERQYPFTYKNTNYNDQSGRVMPFNDNGFGTNGISSYRSIKTLDSTLNQPILIQTPDNLKGRPLQYSYVKPDNKGTIPNFRSDKTHIFFQFDRYFYALNKNKIGRYQQSATTDSTGTYITGLKHEYLDGSPYDFILGWDPLTTTALSPQGQPLANPKVLGYEVSEKTIYQVILWQSKTPKSTYYDQSLLEVRTYDIFTGAYLATSFNTVGPILLPGTEFTAFSSGDGDHLSLFNRGDDLVVFMERVDWYMIRSAKTVARTFDRSGSLLGYTEIPTLAPKSEKDSSNRYYQCGPNTSDWFKGVHGEYYRYESLQCTNSSVMDYSDGAYLVKLNPDLTLAWRTRLSTAYPDRAQARIFDDFAAVGDTYQTRDQREIMILNPLKNQIYTKVFQYNFSNEGYNSTFVYEVVDMNTGAVTPQASWIRFNPDAANFVFDGNGNPVPITNTSGSIYNAPGSRTVEGNQTEVIKKIVNGTNQGQRTVTYTSGGALYNEMETGTPGTLDLSPPYASQIYNQVFAEYFGDGLLVTGYNTVYNGNKYTDFAFYLNVGTPSDLPKQFDGFQIGQFQSPFTIDNTEIGFTLNMEKAKLETSLAGFSFRMTDPRNRYAVETNGTTLYLSKYVNGSRTVLSSVAYPFQDGTAYRFAIKASGNQLSVDLNGVPYLSATDSTFASGKIGPFSDKSYISFSGISTKALPVQTTAWQEGYAIWENGQATAQYSGITFTDPENDPKAGSYTWSYVHTPKFLNNQGLSTLNGKTVTSAQTVFDKVGVYDVTLQARDDPNPSYLSPSNGFDAYRKASNPYGVKVTVHRRPIAAFTLTVNADGSVTWNDTSYDPDRWASATNYSAPDTPGMNYGVDRGITERKYYYIDPGGNLVERQLVRPSMTGNYEVGLMVKDEYGAWSNPVTTNVTIGTVPQPNTLPTAALTYPTGTQAAPTLVYTTKPTISWNQTDPDAGNVFTAYNVRILDKNGDPAPGSGEKAQSTSAASASWTVLQDLVRGVTYQVQVQVKDKAGEWSAWSNIGWMKINSQPSALITSPSGSQTSPTLIVSNKRPTITWTQTDPDRSYFARFDLQVKDEAGTMVYDSGMVTQNATIISKSFAIPTDLPTGKVLQARVKVTDDDVNLWSDWSNTVWFVINYPPAVTITNPSGTQTNPTITGPTPLLSWTQTDPDPNTSYSAYQIRILSENGATEYLNTGVVGQSTTDTSGSCQVKTPLPQGLKLQVVMKVWDQYGTSSAWSAARWMLTNRPPSADFDWSPKPIWEGDAFTITNLSADPDQNPLQFLWTIVQPDGNVMKGTTRDVSIPFALPGNYSVNLSASDGFTSDSMTKVIVVSPLTILPDVGYTPEWLEKHQAKGHRTDRPPKEFYSGEILVVRTLTSPAPVRKVTAWIDDTGMDGSSLRIETELSWNAQEAAYTGELHDKQLSSLTGRLADGEHIVHFKVEYGNGVVKTGDIPICIIGSVHQAVQVHRLQ